MSNGFSGGYGSMICAGAALTNNSSIFIHNSLSDLGFYLSIYVFFTLNNSIYFEKIISE